MTLAIAGPLGVRNHLAGNRDRAYQTQLERVIDALRNSDRLLIIDEAHALKGAAPIELLRDIHDTTGVPIMCLATKDFHDRLVENADADHGQIYSRFDVIHHQQAGLPVDGGPRRLQRRQGSVFYGRHSGVVQ